ncbi:hypothetical protein PtB15_6B443 [Puccinia triticina]|nr:hypothetical protein PtB15_6B443 [Puccinia triticina]
MSQARRQPAGRRPRPSTARALKPTPNAQLPSPPSSSSPPARSTTMAAPADQPAELSTARLLKPKQPSRRLVGMKERNERIFASINASLNPAPPTHPPEPALPPPPPSTSSSSSTSSANLNLPHHHTTRSGLIPFAKGSSPSPRKISSSTAKASLLDPESTSEDDEQKYGSVRHKRTTPLKPTTPERATPHLLRIRLHAHLIQ